MQQQLTFKYSNSTLHIGLNNWREVYLLKPTLVQLSPEVRCGKLVYRAKGSSRRISYAQIKCGLVKKSVQVEIEVPNWLLP